jgi:putative acetyltransferase
MRIRKSKIEDAAELAKLTRATVRTVNAQDHDKEIIKAWSKGNTAALYRTSEKTRIRFVAIESAEIVGFTDMLPDGELMSLYVHPKHLGKGIGKRLLAHIEKEAKTMGIKLMHCQSSVNAKRFYQKHGYKVLKPEWWTVEGVPPMRVYKMEKQL